MSRKKEVKESPAKPIEPEAGVTLRKTVGVEYSEDLGKRICAMLREGSTLRTICSGPDMPHESTVREWAANPDHPIAPHYARSREIGYQKMADDLVDISDGKAVALNELDAKLEDQASDRDAPKDAVQRDRLRIDTRKWLLSKALPKIYGDKLTLDGDLKVTMPEDQLDSRLGHLLAKAAAKQDADTVH